MNNKYTGIEKLERKNKRKTDNLTYNSIAVNNTDTAHIKATRSHIKLQTWIKTKI